MIRFTLKALTLLALLWTAGGAANAQSLSPGTLTFSNTDTGFTTAAQTATLMNSTSSTLTISKISEAGADPNDFPYTTTCGTTLAVSSTCTISVKFSPTAGGSRGATITIIDNGSSSGMQQLSVSGLGIAVPSAAVTPTSLTFAGTNQGTTSTAQTVTISNSGTAALTISSIAITGADPRDFTQTNPCNGTVATFGTCTLSITFTPAAAGPRTAVLTIADNSGGAANSQQTVMLSGTGLAVPVASLTPATLTFGSSGGVQNAMLSNTGSGPLTIASVALGGVNASNYSISSNGCGSSLANGSSCTIAISYTPGTSGTYVASLTVTDNSGSVAGSTQFVSLSGSSAGTAGATVSPTSLVFANTPVNTASTAQKVTVTNGGTAALAINAIAISGINAGDFSSTNTCGSSLAAGSNCSILIIFTPTALGARSASLTITDNAGGTVGAQQTVSLMGTGSGIGMAGLSPTSLTFPSTAVNVTSSGQQISLSNIGSGPLTLTSVAVAGTNATDFTSNNNCNGSVAAGSSCTISVFFTPTAVGSRTATLTVTDDAGGPPGSQQFATLTGTGAGVPTASVSPTSLTFGSQNTGTASAAQLITISNAGGGPLTLSSVVISGANSVEYPITNTCGGNVAAGGSCTVSVTFSPTVAGASAATLIVTDNANNVANSQQTVTLSGTGVGVASASLSPSPLGFPNTNVNSSSSLSTTLSNNGTGALTIATIGISGTNAGDFSTSNSCNGSVAAGSACVVTVIFTPTVAGSRTAILTVTDNAGGSPGNQQFVTLTGSGLGIPNAALAPLTISFGSVNLLSGSTVQNVTLSNTGSGALTISSIAIGGTNPGDFGTTNNCGGSLAAGANCSISITFIPTVAGARSASLIVTDNSNNTANSMQTSALSGVGVAVPNATVSPSSLDLGGSNTGVKTASKSVTVSNSGSGPLTISNILVSGANAGDFAETDNCNGSVVASGSCIVSVAFDPSAAGIRSAVLTVTDNAGNTANSQQSVVLSGTGIAVPMASVSPTSIGFGATTLPQNVTLTNTGTGPLSISGAPVISGTNASNFAIIANSCGSSLSAGSSCVVTISFTSVSSSSSSAVVTITDNSNNASGSIQTVSLLGQSALTVLTSSLASGTVGTFYSAAVVPQGGTSPYTWMVSSGSLPAGTSLNATTGFVTGTPTSAGVSTFTIKVTDSGTPAQSVSQPFSINIAASALTIQAGPTLTGKVGVSYSSTATAMGGTPPYAWSVTSGTLPAGLLLNATSGAITGTPTTAGTSTFTLKVSDSSAPAQAVSQAYSVAISPASLSISSTSLPNGTANVPYTFNLAATGGTAAYSWSISTGTLPAGLTLNSSSGMVTGTPTIAGSSTFTVRVTDSGAPAQTATTSYTVAINTGLTITTTSLAAGTVGLSYSATLAAQNGMQPLIWTLGSGMLPMGVTLSTAGILNGIPTTAGSFTFVVKLVDSSSPAQSTTQGYSLLVNSPVTNPVIPTFSINGLTGATPGTTITAATVQLSPASSAAYAGNLTAAFTPNSTLTDLPAGYLGDAGFGSGIGAKSATSSIAIPGGSTSAPLPSVDPGTVAGTLAVTLAVGGTNVATSSLTIQPLAPIIEANSVQVANVSSTGFDVELVATSTTRDLETATFVFTPAAGAQLSGSTTFIVNVSALFTPWFVSTNGLNYGGAFSLSIPFTLSGSTSAIGSVSVTLTNSVGTSNAASAAF